MYLQNNKALQEACSLLEEQLTDLEKLGDIHEVKSNDLEVSINIKFVCKNFIFGIEGMECSVELNFLLATLMVMATKYCCYFQLKKN
jgi:hypothetical protein